MVNIVKEFPILMSKINSGSGGKKHTPLPLKFNCQFISENNNRIKRLKKQHFTIIFKTYILIRKKNISLNIFY
jgi:hypothetical protein